MDEILRTLDWVYANNIDVLAMKAFNLLLAVFLVWRFLGLAVKAQKGSLSITLRLLAYAFLAFAGFEIISIILIFSGYSVILAYVPLLRGVATSIRWSLLASFAETVFLAAVLYAIGFLGPSLEAHSFMAKRKGKGGYE